MGLFSSSGKNKQDSATEDSAYYSRAEDDSAGLARARAKRANSAGEPAGARRKEGRAPAADPVLPEKKRARRRLVGAVALALAVAVGLPMLLDSEPKPLAGDIAIQIPSKDKPLADIAPAASASASAGVVAADTLDKREEFIAPPKAAAAAVVAAAVASAPVKAEAKPEPKADAKVEVKAEPKAADSKHADKADIKTVDLKHADKVAEKPAEKSADKAPAKVVKTDDKAAIKPARLDDKPAAKAPADAPPDTARALAILEGKGADAPAAAAPKVVLQVAALGSADKVAELQARLKEAGISSHTEKGTNQTGEHVIRVKVGPFNKDEADKVRAKLGKLGLSGFTVPG